MNKPAKRPSTRTAKAATRAEGRTDRTGRSSRGESSPRGNATGRPARGGAPTGRTPSGGGYQLAGGSRRTASAGTGATGAPRRSRVTGTRTFDMMDPTEPQRLSKIMAAKGLCSRREADYLIEKGWVRVDGKVVSELGTKVLPSAKIDLDARAKNNLSKQVTILYHKPIGVVSGQPEGRYRAAMEMIGSDNQFDKRSSTPFTSAMLKGLAPAGRLDIDSTGLLVLTQDGRIARQLIDESSDVEKEYMVRVEGQPSNNALELLRHGLIMDGQPLKPARVSWLNEDQLKFILVEGKKRQIRRMCEMVGLKVTGLKRIRIGRIMLSDLPVGSWRLLKPEERF